MITKLLLFLGVVILINAQEPLNCDEIKIGNTKRSKEGSAWFSFTISSNITKVWISTCGSAFHTYLHVYDSNDTLIAYNNGTLSSPCDVDKAFLYLTNLTIGDYTLELTESGNGFGGDYSVQMFCNEFNGWSERKTCNHVLNQPINVCTDGYGSYQTICYQGIPQIRWYLESTSCTGNYTARNWTSLSLDDYTCDADVDCNYTHVIWRYGSEDICWNYTEVVPYYERLTLRIITDICLPGNQKFFCSDNSFGVGVYPDTSCSKTPIASNEQALGDCVYDENWNVTELVWSIQCISADLHQANRIRQKFEYFWVICIAAGVIILGIVVVVLLCYKRKLYMKQMEKKESKDLDAPDEEDDDSDLEPVASK